MSCISSAFRWERYKAQNIEILADLYAYLFKRFDFQTSKTHLDCTCTVYTSCLDTVHLIYNPQDVSGRCKSVILSLFFCQQTIILRTKKKSDTPLTTKTVVNNRFDLD